MYQNIDEQECISVRCVPSAAVAICWGVSAQAGCLPRQGGGVCPGGVSQHALRQTPPAVDRILDTRF